MLMDMGLIGWLVSLALGFVLGGVFFLSMKLQVEYVVSRRGPVWLMPVATYARLAFVAAILVTVALAMRDARQKIPAAMIAAVAGAFVARILIGRSVRAGDERQDGEGGSGDD